MNINDLTIGEARQLASMIASLGQAEASAQPTSTTRHPMLGAYVIARCYAAGVHAGIVDSVDGENVTLLRSRRLWAWQAKDGVALSGVAQNGLKDKGCKIDTMNPVIYLTGVCELIPTASGVQEQINEWK